MNDIAGIDQAKPNSAGDRRSDVRIDQLQLGVINLGLIGFDGAIELADRSSLGVQLLLGNDAFLKKQA